MAFLAAGLEDGQDVGVESGCFGGGQAGWAKKAEPAIKTKMLTPRVSILRFPVFRQGDVHGRIRFDGIATAKTVCDWILGCAGNEVKKKIRLRDLPLNILSSYRLLGILVFVKKLWKTCS